MSTIKHVTLQKIVAHDFRYDPRKYLLLKSLILTRYDMKSAKRTKKIRLKKIFVEVDKPTTVCVTLQPEQVSACNTII